MKMLLLSLIILTNFFQGKAQIEKEQLVGDWLKVKIENLHGLPCEGKYGTSGEYLRFSITKKNITVSEAPYDMGFELYYNFKNDTIMTPFYNRVEELPEKYYFVEKVDGDSLLLRTSFEGKEIRYFFVNQAKYKSDFRENNYLCDNDTLVLMRGPSKYGPVASFYSNAFATEHYFKARPLYDGGNRLGDHFCQKLRFNEDLVKGEISGPIKVSFDIDYKGQVSNISLLKGFNEHYDNQLIKLIEKTNKIWEPTVIDSPEQKVTMVFTFLILDK